MDHPKSARTRLRGLVLTDEALKLLDQELRKWWENSGGRELSETGRIRKLTRVVKAEGMGLDASTVDKLYR